MFAKLRFVMKKIIVSIIAALVSLAAFAQSGSALAAKVQSLGSTRVEFVVNGTFGVLDVQYPNFNVIMTDMHLYGTSDKLVIYTPKTVEVVISKPLTEQLLKDSVLSTASDGSQTLTYTQKDGNKMVFKILGIEKMAEPWKTDHFELDLDTLGDPIVTDMR
jgi:hypothetical protein